MRWISSSLLCLALLVASAAADARAFVGGKGAAGTGVVGPNVTSVTLAGGVNGENVAPGSPAGTVLDGLTAMQGASPCTTCTFSMVNSGLSSDGPLCSASSNNFQVVSTGAGTANLEVMNTSLAAQVYGAPPAIQSYVCVKATPSSGSPYTFPFSVMVRGPTFLALAPRQVQYTNPATTGTVLATLSTVVYGASGTTTYTLGGDTMCGLLTLSGSTLSVGATTLTNQSGVCHVTATQAGVGWGMVGTNAGSYVAAVWVRPGPYSGPGDSAVGMTWKEWTFPYAFSNAYATAGSPIWTVIRERDRASFTANALANGDIDLVGLANFCKTSMCVASGSGAPSALPGQNDQSGSGNDMSTWDDALGHPYYTTFWRPQLYFDAMNGVMPAWTNSNATDRLWYNTSFGGAGATGALWSVAEKAPGSITSYLISLNATSGVSNPIAHLNNVLNAVFNGSISGTTLTVSSTTFGAVASNTTITAAGITPGTTITGGSNPTWTVSPSQTTGTINGITDTSAGIYVGTDSGGQTVTIGSPISDGVCHSNIAVIDGASSIYMIDGTQVAGTLPTASLVAPLGEGGDFGGGSLTGLMAGIAISTTVPTSGQLAQLLAFDQSIFGVGGTC